MALTSGTRFGAYEIVGAIGAGGMGEVYRATDTTLGRQVAVKVLPEIFAADPVASMFAKTTIAARSSGNTWLLAVKPDTSPPCEIIRRPAFVLTLTPRP